MEKTKEDLKIKYIDIWGLRKEKYKWLERHDVKDTEWQELSPADPYYFFVPKSEEGWDVYQNFLKVTDIFPVNSVGIVTSRDNFVIDFDKNTLKSRIRTFINTDDKLAETAFGLRNKKNWAIREAQQELKEAQNWQDYMVEVLYRPFDKRWIIYHPAVIERDRKETMGHMLRSNLALIVNRTIKTENIDHFWITDKINDLHIIETANASAYTFPLYLYEGQISYFQKKGEITGVRAPNISTEFQALLNNTYNPQPVTTSLEKQKAFGVPPEEIFYYIYAILYSKTYRQKYQEFLKIDFPRVPFTKDYKLFQKLGKLGEQLVDLHLLKSSELSKPTTKFWGDGDNVVGMRKFVDEERAAEFVDVKVAGYWPQAGEKPRFKSRGIVRINEGQFFGPVPKEVWEHHIGGYQVLDKWLKDRKGRALSSEDIKHYCKIVTALQKTVELQKQIDKLYSKVEKNLIK